MPRIEIFDNVQSINVIQGGSDRYRDPDLTLEVRKGNNREAVGFSQSENELISFAQSLSEAADLEIEKSVAIEFQGASWHMVFMRLLLHSMYMAMAIFLLHEFIVGRLR